MRGIIREVQFLCKIYFRTHMYMISKTWTALNLEISSDKKYKARERTLHTWLSSDHNIVNSNFSTGSLAFLLGSQSKDDGNDKDNARNDDLIGWMRKNNRAARAARTLVQFLDVVCQMTRWKFPNLRFSRQREHQTVNLSFTTFTSTALLPVHLQRALSTIKNARKK